MQPDSILESDYEDDFTLNQLVKPVPKKPSALPSVQRHSTGHSYENTTIASKTPSAGFNKKDKWSLNKSPFRQNLESGKSPRRKKICTATINFVCMRYLLYNMVIFSTRIYILYCRLIKMSTVHIALLGTESFS